MRCDRITLAGLFIALAVGSASANDWISAPSYYTHDPQTRERVQQYSPIGPFYVQQRTDYQQSGYWHTRSSIQVGQSRDNLHIVREWGRPVRPYGEWRFPYRPHSVPYQLWGEPFGGLGNAGRYPRGFRGPGVGVRPNPVYPTPGPDAGRRPGHNSQTRPQWSDGDYPPYQESPRMPDRRFFSPPIDPPARPPVAVPPTATNEA